MTSQLDEEALGLDEWRNWDEKSKTKFLAAVELEAKKKLVWYCKRGRTCDGKPHDQYDYPHARGDQWPPVGADWLVWLLRGGRGCVAPWTRIWDEGAQEYRRVDEVGELTVLSTHGAARTLGSPFVKGTAEQWTVTTEDGHSITVTDQHQFLSEQSWLPLSALRVGQPIASVPHGQPSAVSSFRSGYRAGAPSSSDMPAGSQVGYRKCHRCGDPLSLQGEGGAQAHVPELGDADARTHPWLRGDAPAGAGGCSHAYPQSSHPARSDSSSGEPCPLGEECHGEPLRAEQLLHRAQSPVRSLRTSFLERTSSEADLHRSQIGPSPSLSAPCDLCGNPESGLLPQQAVGEPFGSLSHSLTRPLGVLSQSRTSAASEERPYPYPTRWTRIVSIEYSHFGEFYDLQVPGPNNYVAEGLFNHNSGKTRSGAEWTRKSSETIHRTSIIGPTLPHVREVMVEGDSGLLACYDNAKVPALWEPSKRRITITAPNGKEHFVQAFTAEEPERLRGPQHGAVWLDEPAHMKMIQATWDNMMFGLRLGKNPRILCSTTPLPIKWLKDLIAEPDTVSVTVSTYANLDNLAPTFKKVMLNKYEGTRLGQQELHGEILDDIVGAMWTWAMIEENRDDGADLSAADMDRIVVSIDPAGTSDKKRDETGIIVVGKRGNDFYVLADRSGHYTPEGWAEAAWKAYDEFQADKVVAEKNYGGEMVSSTLRNSRKNSNGFCDSEPKLVNSRRGKKLRAEPVVGLYEQGRVHHVGIIEELETQMTEWVPDQSDSPDRVDALVHGVVELSGMSYDATVAVPSGNFERRPSGGRLWTPR